MNNPFIPILNSLLPEPHASLLNGILFGTKASMPNEFYQALVTTGTLHVIALSGMNITIMITLIAALTLFLGRRVSIILTIAFLVFFVLFVGPTPSVVRAAIMGCMSLTAVYFGRQDWGMLGLFLAAGIMLLTNFSLISNLSFQLSFLATFGIILAGRSLKCQQGKGWLYKLYFPLKENLALTLSAQLFTLPVLFYNFHRISLISPVSNLLIGWTVQPVMVLGLVTAIAGSIWLPLGMIPAWFTWVPLCYFINVIQLLARIPGASIQF